MYAEVPSLDLLCRGHVSFNSARQPHVFSSLQVSLVLVR